MRRDHAALARKFSFRVQAPPAPRRPTPSKDIIASTRSTDLDLSAPPTTDTEPRPEFLELVGRLSATYCPPLLTTEVVDASRAALVGRARGPLDEVEVLARSALDARLAEAASRPTGPQQS
ncbi:hypothetical protein [Microlunatus antarcticus]|uniref:Uncharacterized protein n=1 Tax=Microlunatus antarcticus TaxID=53388 RepID=A0A7W5JV23_9ACTN|nr:hypothetical protein [Microlunatus antarcticus]MBB3326904.1 hypothetical protein [Microlunatus antarcticus]